MYWYVLLLSLLNRTYFIQSSIEDRKLFWNANMSSKFPTSLVYSTGVNLKHKIGIDIKL